MPDRRFVDAYNRIELDPARAEHVWSRIEQELLPGKENEASMKTGKTLRIALIAAAICVLLMTSAYAISGTVRGTGTHAMKDTGSYDTLEVLPEAEKTAGYPITAPERFTNGYQFKSLNVGGEAAYGEDNEILKEYYSILVEYLRDGKNDLSLSLSPVLELPTERERPEPNEIREIDGIEVRFSRDHFKFVPENYEKTEEDLAAEAAGHYYVSFGADEIMEYDYTFAGFVLGDVEYTLFDQSGRDSAFLFPMAEEIISAWQTRESAA